MKRAAYVLMVALIAGSGLSLATYAAYRGVYHPYFIQPNEDREFLSKHPTRQEVLEWFSQKPEEPLQAGERFQMTGWRPLPARAASHDAYSFTRMSGKKIYVFFDAQGRVEEFVMATS